jgi:hypothetical protein
VSVSGKDERNWAIADCGLSIADCRIDDCRIDGVGGSRAAARIGAPIGNPPIRVDPHSAMRLSGNPLIRSQQSVNPQSTISNQQ